MLVIIRITSQYFYRTIHANSLSTVNLILTLKKRYSTVTKSSGADEETCQEFHPLLLRGPLPFQTLLRSPFVSVFGVSGSVDSISPPEVQKPQSILTGPQVRTAAPRREKRSTASRRNLRGFTWGKPTEAGGASLDASA